MFNRAWNGLMAQGFERSATGNSCVYRSDDGKRCAWGHVDTSLAHEIGGVESLHSRGLGLAKFLYGDDLQFAAALQNAHDSGYTPSKMATFLRAVAEQYYLTVPE